LSGSSCKAIFIFIDQWVISREEHSRDMPVQGLALESARKVARRGARGD
jgi:hypothetical protein